MKRGVVGLVLVGLGVLLLFQELGLANLGLQFWPVVMTLFGGVLIWSGLRWWPSWIKIALGLWVGSIGLFTILHNAGVSPIRGSDITAKGWPFLLIAIGLSALLGGGFRVRWSDRRMRKMHMVGDIRYGGDRWLLEKDLRLDQGIGDVKIDLTTADIPEGTHQVDIDVKIGDVVIRVPDNVTVVADGTVNMGELQVLDEHHAGMGGLQARREVRIPDCPTTLHISGRVRIGKLTITREPARTPRMG